MQMRTLNVNLILIRLTVVNLGALMVLSACVINDDRAYPKDWPRLSTTLPGTCPDIQGKFDNTGDCDSSNGGCTPKTISLLFWPCLHDIPKCEDDRPGEFIFEIKQPNISQLTIAKLRADDSSTVWTRTLRNMKNNSVDYMGGFAWQQQINGFECEEGNILIHRSRFATEIANSIWMDESAAFTKSIQGDLIARVCFKSYSLLLGIPGRLYGCDWFRWRPKH